MESVKTDYIFRNMSLIRLKLNENTENSKLNNFLCCVRQLSNLYLIEKIKEE